MWRVGAVVLVLASGCGSGFSNGGTGELALLALAGAAGVGAAMQSRGEEGRRYDELGYPTDVYYCPLSSDGGEEIDAPDAERARARCIALHGERRDVQHCACASLFDAYGRR